MTTSGSEVVRGAQRLQRIVRLDVGPGHKVRARFEDGAEVEADLGTLVAGSPWFAPLADPAAFAAARPVDRGAGIEWPGEIDYSAGALRRLAEAQGGTSAPAPASSESGRAA